MKIRNKAACAAALSGLLALGALAPAQAAPAPTALATPASLQAATGLSAKKPKPSVKLRNIKAPTVMKKTVTIKPSYQRTGKTKIVSAVLTVKSGKKTVAKNKKSVALQPGKYTVQQTVKYKLASGKKWGKTKTATKKQSLTVKVVPWSSFAYGQAAGIEAGLNKRRAAKNLKPFIDGPDGYAKKLRLAMNKGDFDYLFSFEANTDWEGPAVNEDLTQDPKAFKKLLAKTTWYDLGYADGKKFAQSERFFPTKMFISKKVSSLHMATYTWADKKTNYPENQVGWLIAI